MSADRSAYRLLSLLGDARALQRGPDALLRRKVRRQVANRRFNAVLRRLVRP